MESGNRILACTGVVISFGGLGLHCSVRRERFYVQRGVCTHPSAINPPCVGKGDAGKKDFEQEKNLTIREDVEMSAPLRHHLPVLCTCFPKAPPPPCSSGL